MEADEELNVMDVGAKWKSKKELYTILTTTGDLYLPPISCANQKYLREICNRSKLYIKWSELIVAQIPNVKGLEVESILSFASEHADIQKYLPEYEYQKEPSREWIWNLVKTLVHNEFQSYVQDKLNKRESELIKNKNLKISATPEIVDIIKRSKAVSTSKGKSHFLLRPVIKRKSKKQAELENKKKEEEDKYLNDLHEKHEEMKKTIQGFEEMNEEAFENREKLAKLYELGVIDSDGEPKKDED